jgi:hypothetical protein
VMPMVSATASQMSRTSLAVRVRPSIVAILGSGTHARKPGGRDTSTEQGALCAQYSLTLPSMSR